MLDTNLKCVVDVVSLDNGTYYLDRYWLNRNTGEIERSFGVFGFDPANDAVLVMYVYPVEYLTSHQMMAVGEGYFVSFSCSECGYYGREGAGIHPYAYTRASQPNCTMTDPIWKQLAAKSIPISALTLIDQSGCQKLYDFVAEIEKGRVQDHSIG